MLSLYALKMTIPTRIVQAKTVIDASETELY